MKYYLQSVFLLCLILVVDKEKATYYKIVTQMSHIKYQHFSINKLLSQSSIYTI